MEAGEVADPQSPSGEGNAALHIPRAVARAQRVGPLDRRMEVALTFVLRPRDRQGLEARARRGPALSLDEIDRRFGPSPTAARRVLNWLRSEGIMDGVISPGGGLVDVRVPVPSAERLLRTYLDVVRIGGVRGYAPRQEPLLPAEVAPLVSAILGLNGLPRPHRRKLRSRIEQGAQGPASGGGFMPTEIRAAYGLPDPLSLLDGRGECLCLLEFGSGYVRSDLETFWQRAGVRSPAVDVVWAVPPGQEPPPPDAWVGSDLEATSDLEWAGALAPGARFVVLNGTVGASSQSFAQALARSLETVLTLPERPSAVSISYGDGEIFFSAAELSALDHIAARLAACGVSVLAASGDDGAYGVSVPVGPVQTVDVPASLPHVLAVGGTHLEIQDRTVAKELGWSDIANNGASGGGVSEVFPAPVWQESAGVGAATGTPTERVGRGVPDVAANADPLTGYRVVVGGELGVVGGTSLATPVWAAALTIVNQRRLAGGNGPLGLAAPKLYALGGRSRLIRDILVGDNTYLSAPGFACRTGWDAVTGVGSPAGEALWDTLSEGPVPGRTERADGLPSTRAKAPEPEPVSPGSEGGGEAPEDGEEGPEQESWPSGGEDDSGAAAGSALWPGPQRATMGVDGPEVPVRLPSELQGKRREAGSPLESTTVLEAEEVPSRRARVALQRAGDPGPDSAPKAPAEPETGAKAARKSGKARTDVPGSTTRRRRAGSGSRPKGTGKPVDVDGSAASGSPIVEDAGMPLDTGPGSGSEADRAGGPKRRSRAMARL